MDAITELGKLAEALRTEQQEDYQQHEALLRRSGIQERKKNGLTWFPLRITDTGYGLGAYPFIVVERNPGDQLPHHFSQAAPVSLFSAAQDEEEHSLQGTIGYVDDSRMKIFFRTDELPEWLDLGKIGVNLLFDSKSYDEMFKALNFYINVEKGRGRTLRDILLGYSPPTFIPVKYDGSDILNDSQNQAVQAVLDAQDIAVIHGPPGTGKTTTLTAAIARVLEKENQVLVCAPSNAATDHLTRSCFARGLKTVRIGNLARVEEDTTSHTLDAILAGMKETKQIKELKKRAVEMRKIAGKYRRQFGREEQEQRKALMQEAKNINREAREMENYLVQKVLDEAQVITCTLIGSMHEYLNGREFDTVFIDEAGQAIEPAVWVPIQKAQRVIMAGDPMQLPPTVKSQEAVKKGLTKTLIEKIIERQDQPVLLRTQYRMHEQIMAFSNQSFYENKLEAHVTVAQRCLSFSPQPVEFIDTAGCGFDEAAGQDNTSLANREEANLIIKHVEAMREAGLKHESIGIISPYRAQVDVLRQDFTGQEMVTVNTVDSFQGQERDIIYISMVRSNAEGEIGFLKDYRRMNVAMTRARMKLVIVGDSATLGNDRFYSNFLLWCEQHGYYRSAWEFVNQ